MQVLGDVVVEDGVTLTIAPGTRVEFQDYFRLTVHGTLDARGRADRPITFTSAHPELFALDASRTGCWNGLRFEEKPAHNAPSRLEHCVIEFSKAVGGAGAHPDGGGALSVEGCAGVELVNCSLRSNLAAVGGALFLYRQANVRIVGCLIADNHALENAAAVYCAYSYPTIANCTVVANRIHNASNPYSETFAIQGFVAKLDLAHDIVWDNTPDVVYQHAQTFGAKSALTRKCDVEDWPGGGDSFSLDPRFVDAAAGDWRLGFASPCVDAGERLDDAAHPPLHDLDGRERSLDGDLDTHPRLDLGAYEFAPLELATDGALGGSATCRLWGEDGGTGTLYVARGGLSPRALATPFGGLRLEPRGSFAAGTCALGAAQPGTLVLALPSDPALVGERFGFQALSTSSHAPAGRALTNALEITLALP